MDHDLPPVRNGGSARGYKTSLGRWPHGSPVATRLRPRLAVFLYIAMLGVNVLNCRREVRPGLPKPLPRGSACEECGSWLQRPRMLWRTSADPVPSRLA